MLLLIFEKKKVFLTIQCLFLCYELTGRKDVEVLSFATVCAP